jgi:hypothetical protein
VREARAAIWLALNRDRVMRRKGEADGTVGALAVIVATATTGLRRWEKHEPTTEALRAQDIPAPVLRDVACHTGQPYRPGFLPAW